MSLRGVYQAMFATQSRQHIVLAFFDAVDFDNLFTIWQLLKRLKPDSELHVVITGRPVNLASCPVNLKTNTFKTPNDVEVTFSPAQHVKEGKEESQQHSEEHAQLLLENNIRTFAQVLQSDRVKFYNGGIAPIAGLSGAVHAMEDLFFTPTGQVRSKEEYYDLLHFLHEQTAEERVKFRLAEMKKKPEVQIGTIVDLANELTNITEWEIYLGGPFTGFAQLIDRLTPEQCQLPGKINGMFGSLDKDGKSNLLKRNFNEAVDPTAFKRVMIDANRFPNCEIRVYPTETCKNTGWLTWTREEFDQHNNSPIFSKFHALWKGINRNQDMPIFDFAVLFDNPPFKSKQVVFKLGDDGRSYMEDDANSNIRVFTTQTQFCFAKES